MPEQTLGRLSTTRGAPPRRPHYAVMALGYMALAIYGSLVPFDFRPLALEDAVARFREIRYLPLGLASRSDLVANILLFIPLGYLLMAAWCADRRWVFCLGAAPVVIAFAAGLSVAIEFTQLFFLPRTVSLNDMAAESIGGVLGVLAWLAHGQRVTHWARRVWMVTEMQGLAARLLPAYFVILMIVHVLPMDLTLSPVEVYHKYRGGKIVLVPFSHRPENGMDIATKTLWNMAYFAPLGFLTALLPHKGPMSGGSWRRGVVLGFSAAGFVEFLQLFVYTRFFDVSDIVTGTAAVLAGWWVGRVWSGQPTGGASEAGPMQRTAT